MFVVPKIDFRCRTCFETIEDLNYTTYEHGIEQYFYPKIKDKCGYHIDKCSVSDTVLLSSESNPDTFQTLPSELVECCYPDQYNDVVNILSGNPDALEQCSALITEFEGKNATDPSAIPEVYQNYVPCDSKSYIFSKDRFETTATEDFSLVCGRSWLLDLTGSIYYLGFGIGGITTGWIADVYGRKYITIFCIACSIVADIVTGYVNTTELFLLMRFVNGFFTNGMMVPAFTLCIGT